MTAEAPTAPARPSSLGPDTIAALPPVVLVRAGDALLMARQVEATVRRHWQDLIDLPGEEIDARARLLARAAQRLVEGPRCALARALVQQSLPWNLDEPPARGVLQKAAHLVARLREQRELADRRSELQGRLQALSNHFSEQLPRRWAAWFGSRRITREWIAAMSTPQELDAVQRTLEAGGAALAAWEREVREWLTQVGAEAPPTEAPGALSAAPPLAALEARYELLLKLGAVDRGPAQTANAGLLRRAMLRRLKHLARDVTLGSGDAFLRIVEQVAESRSAGAMDADELWTYAQAIACYRQRADEGMAS